MEFSENHPERRNVLLMCMAIIIFHVGQGSFKDNELSFALVTMTFSNPEALGNLAWVVNMYFLFRYWVVTRESMFPEIYTDLSREWSGLIPRLFIRQMIREIAIENDTKPDSFFLDRFRIDIIKNQSAIVRLRYERGGSGDTYSKFYEPDIVMCFSIIFYISAKSIVTLSTPTRYLVPYLVFFFAVLTEFGVVF